MNLSKLNIGILHSLIGKNDGVSIVIDQSIEAMVRYMDVSQDNIYFLSALAPARLNKLEDDIFWHKNEANKYILKHYQAELPEGFASFIEDHVTQAEHLIEQFIEDYHIDLMIVHNGSHPTNFIYATAVGGTLKMLRLRRSHAAFHPKSGFRIHHWGDDLFVIERGIHTASPLFAVHNISANPQSLPHVPQGTWLGLCRQQTLSTSDVNLPPRCFVWLHRV